MANSDYLLKEWYDLLNRFNSYDKEKGYRHTYNVLKTRQLTSQLTSQFTTQE